MDLVKHPGNGINSSELITQPPLHILDSAMVQVVNFLPSAIEHGPCIFFVELVELFDIGLSKHVFVFAEFESFKLLGCFVVHPVRQLLSIDLVLELLHLLDLLLALQPFVEDLLPLQVFLLFHERLFAELNEIFQIGFYVLLLQLLVLLFDFGELLVVGAALSCALPIILFLEFVQNYSGFPVGKPKVGCTCLTKLLVIN